MMNRPDVRKLGSVGERRLGHAPEAEPSTDIILTLDRWLRRAMEVSAVMIFVATAAVALWLTAHALG